MKRRNRARLAEDAAAGFSAGILGGIIMALVMMADSFEAGGGFWFPMKLIAAAVFGPRAIIGGWPTVLMGSLLHLFVAGSWGIVFSLVFQHRFRTDTAVVEGLFFAIAVWAVMTFLIVPVADPVLSPRMAMMSAEWFVVHLIYGATLGVTPMLHADFWRTGRRNSSRLPWFIP